MSRQEICTIPTGRSTYPRKPTANIGSQIIPYIIEILFRNFDQFKSAEPTKKKFASTIASNPIDPTRSSKEILCLYPELRITQKTKATNAVIKQKIENIIFRTIVLV
jgi:hypothetical protein